MIDSCSLDNSGNKKGTGQQKGDAARLMSSAKGAASPFVVTPRESITKGKRQMDFTNTTAEALLAHVPEHEDDRWEFKSSQLLDPQEKCKLKKELGKQVSAFANSGGGNIVFGIDEKPRSVRACPELVNRQSMQDCLQIQAFSQNDGSPEIRFTLADYLTPEMVRLKEVENDAERARFRADGLKSAKEFEPKLKAAMEQVRRDLDR